MNATINKNQELIRSQLNRAEASLKQLKESDIFTDQDREILIPRYQEEINLLQRKLTSNNL